MYIDGFLVPVPTDRKDEYVKHAKKAWLLFKEFGATRMAECWGDDVPKGKVTDFYGAVKTEPGETVVFSWIEWPDKKARDEGMKKVMEDPRMKAMSDMPFDGKRMIYGGFESVVDAS